MECKAPAFALNNQLFKTSCNHHYTVAFIVESFIILSVSFSVWYAIHNEPLQDQCLVQKAKLVIIIIKKSHNEALQVFFDIDYLSSLITVEQVNQVKYLNSLNRRRTRNKMLSRHFFTFLAEIRFNK